MSRRVLRARTDVCQLCDFLLPRQFPLRRPIRPQKNFRTFATARRSQAQNSKRIQQDTRAEDVSTRLSPSQKQLPQHLTEDGMEKILEEVKTTCDGLLSVDRVPPEHETLHALSTCNSFAELLVFDHTLPPVEKKAGATSALLSLDESPSGKKIPIHKLPMSFQRTTDELSRIAYSIVTYPTIFITPKVLDAYTTIQANLGKPQTLPEVFHLYANKAIPQENTSPIRYSKQNPNKVSNAIPVDVADRALQAAIDSKELVVAMDIIESSYTTKAFHRGKFVRKCLFPVTGVAVAPVAAYTVASQLATLQTTMDAAMATNVAFAGILAYTVFTGTIGIVAVTTANDQMERVTWAPGMPLRERWMREEERAALDKIAVSWGFRESWRRGEEEGEEWFFLKEHIGGKGMMLDRVELMEGME